MLALATTTKSTGGAAAREPEAVASRRRDPAPLAARDPVASDAPAAADATTGTVPCPCGGGCPRCAPLRIAAGDGIAEAQADRQADRVPSALPSSALDAPGVERRRAPPRPAGAPGSPVPASVLAVLDEPGRPLDGATLQRVGAAAGPAAAAVRVHDGSRAARASAEVGAAAWTVGHHVAYAAGAEGPGSRGGDRLLAHELAHVAQQAAAATPVLARSPEDWIGASRSIDTMSYTELLFEADELQQWLDRQLHSSAETARIEEVVQSLRRRVSQLDAQAVVAGRPPPRTRRAARRAAPAVAAAPLPATRPRILREMTSVSYTDAAEMRAEYDLIMQWLTHAELPGGEREVLETERANLAGLLHGARETAVGERHAARLTEALTPAQSDQGTALGSLIDTIDGIVADTDNDELFYLVHHGERINISRAQRDGLRATMREQLGRAHRQIDSRIAYYWDRYNAQRDLNRRHRVISAIAGLLGGVDDPGLALVMRRVQALSLLRRLDAHLAAGRWREAAAMLPELERRSQVIRAVCRAFYEGYIDGAETAVTVLEITRDVSFAVAASIGAVVAAPFVAGVVAGTGATGLTATGLTIVGTGGVVGTGTGLARGTSAAGGVLAAGGSTDEALAAFRSEGTRGAVEGFLAGAGGSAARALAPALGVGANVGYQAARRIATQAIVNSASAVIDTLARGGSIEQAVQAGLGAAVLSVPGGAVGGNSRLSRELLGPLTGSATAYVGAIANGASPEDARRAATVALATGLATGRAMSGRPSGDAERYAAGRDLGRSARRTVVSTTAAVMIGTADALPPVATVGSGSPSVTLSQPVSGRPAVGTVSAAAPARPSAVTVAPASATAPVSAPATAPATASTTSAVAAPTTPSAASPSVTAAAAVSATTLAPAISQAVVQAPQTSAESEMGIAAAQRSAMRQAFSGNLTSAANATLGAVWTRVANPGEAATLTAGNSRRLFNNHRNRFWRAVRGDAAALQQLRAMGARFPEERNGGAINPARTSAPEIELPDGTRLQITLDHAVERQTDPTRALDPANLRMSSRRENTVVLRLLHQMDPFNNPPPDWTPGP